MLTVRSIASSSRGNAYLVDDGQAPLLIECGLPFKKLQEALNFRVSDLAGCLVSHEHKDHSYAVPELLRAGVRCYMSPGTAAVLGCTGNHRVHVLLPGISDFISCSSWTMYPFSAIHDAEEPLGFVLFNGEDKVLFATDTAYIRQKFPGCTHVMVECNYQAEILHHNVADGLVCAAQRDRLLWSHFSLENVLKMLRANDLSRLQAVWLMHLSRDNSNAEEMKRAVQSVAGVPVYVCDE